MLGLRDESKARLSDLLDAHHTQLGAGALGQLGGRPGGQRRLFGNVGRQQDLHGRQITRVCNLSTPPSTTPNKTPLAPLHSEFLISIPSVCTLLRTPESQGSAWGAACRKRGQSLCEHTECCRPRVPRGRTSWRLNAVSQRLPGESDHCS
jgi:hypothetical protein